MRKDTHKTDVKFLYHEEHKEVFAFFYKEMFSKDPNTFTYYAHIGQHSGCDIGYANECRPATFEEYKDLKSELESLGYNLNVTI